MILLDALDPLALVIGRAVLLVAIVFITSLFAYGIAGLADRIRGPR